MHRARAVGSRDKGRARRLQELAAFPRPLPAVMRVQEFPNKPRGHERPLSCWQGVPAAPRLAQLAKTAVTFGTTLISIPQHCSALSHPLPLAGWLRAEHQPKMSHEHGSVEGKGMQKGEHREKPSGFSPGAAHSTLSRCKSQGPAPAQHATGWAQISMNFQEGHMALLQLTSPNPSRQPVPLWRALYRTQGWL